MQMPYADDPSTSGIRLNPYAELQQLVQDADPTGLQVVQRHVTPHASRLMHHASCLPPHSSRLTLNASRLTSHAECLTLHTSRSMPHGSHLVLPANEDLTRALILGNSPGYIAYAG